MLFTLQIGGSINENELHLLTQSFPNSSWINSKLWRKNYFVVSMGMWWEAEEFIRCSSFHLLPFSNLVFLNFSFLLPETNTFAAHKRTVWKRSKIGLSSITNTLIIFVVVNIWLLWHTWARKLAIGYPVQ